MLVVECELTALYYRIKLERQGHEIWGKGSREGQTKSVVILC